MIKILMFGDVCGKIGRRALSKYLPELRQEYQPDLVIANADNLAHGKGITPDTVRELMSIGVDYLTGGDHAFNQQGAIKNSYAQELPVIRPANFAPQAPGRGFAEISAPDGKQLLLINLIGRVFMRMDHECPFAAVDRILSEQKSPETAVVIDFHAETTSEKKAMLHYLDGRISAIVGTHTHVQTADAFISQNGTAFITDLGMTGFADGILGLAPAGIIDTYLTQIKRKHDMPETGAVSISGVSIVIDNTSSKAVKIDSFQKMGIVN